MNLLFYTERKFRVVSNAKFRFATNAKFRFSRCHPWRHTQGPTGTQAGAKQNVHKRKEKFQNPLVLFCLCAWYKESACTVYEFT